MKVRCHIWRTAFCGAAVLFLSPTLAIAQGGAPVPAGTVDGTSDTLRLDLASSVALALRNATPIQAGRDTMQLAGAAVLEAYGRFLPEVTAVASGFGQDGTTLLSSTALLPASASLYGVGYGLTASLDLFNGFRDREHLRAALRERFAFDQEFGRARQQVAFDVTQAFYQVVLDRRLAEVARANLALSQGREKQLTGQVQAGTRALPDLYRQQAQTHADESAVIDADNRVRDDETGLLRRLEIDPARPVRIVDPAADTTPIANGVAFQSLSGEALRNRPDLAAAQAFQEAATHEVQSAHSEYLPQLTLNLGYLIGGRVYDREIINGTSQLTTAQHPLSEQLGNQGYGVATLGMSWNIFDRYRAHFDVERATVAEDRARLATQDLRLKVVGEVRQAVDDYRAGAEKLTATAAGVQAATKAYQTVQGRFDVGFGTFVDVLSAQAALTQARALHEQALTNFALQKTVLSFVTGRLPLP